MKHFGDITKIDGRKVPIVDIITGGSPCQDLSIAGKRAGLQGERSGLFMEQIRIIKELKEDGTENPTMASLFDGIGGFPLAFQSYGCEPVWASEIEEFPIAVTKKHFPEREERTETE